MTALGTPPKKGRSLSAEKASDPATGSPARVTAEKPTHQPKGKTMTEPMTEPVSDPPATPTTPPTPTAPARAAETAPPVVSGILGTVDTLSDAELIEYQTYDAIVMMGCRSFADVGLALAQIRDHRLYRNDFRSFEDYCRAKCEYGRNDVDRMISAAQLFAHLMTICQQCQPEHESQVRPLIGLSPDQAAAAWGKAVEMAHGRRVTARVVKDAVKELNLTSATAPVEREPRQKQAESRRLLDGALGELLALVSQKASYEALTGKIESLHGLILGLFNPRA